MKTFMKEIWQVALVLVCAAAVAAADSTNMPPPGTLNYVEGQVFVQGRQQTPKSVGSTYLGANQEMDTHQGYAEMLLTPGIYLRLGHNSALTMISPGLANTQVQLTKGSAMLEVDELFKQNNVDVVVGNTKTEVDKIGLYDFQAEPGSVGVLDGKATFFEDDRRINLTKGHEVTFAAAQGPVRQKFDKSQVENDPLYRWSMLRSQYATEANVNEGQMLMAEGGWWGPGWYWDPYWWSFAFMPGWGLGWGPFGYPFFSPWYAGFAPYYGFYGYAPGVAGHYPYPAQRLSSGALPPLAHRLTPTSPGFHSFPQSARTGRMSPMGMAGARSGNLGAVRGGGFSGGGFGGRR
jgi:hypothetical protein